MTKEPVLQLNRQTGCYEGMLLVQVDPELFRRFLINTIEEDGAVDLTDPNTWVQAIAKAGKVTNWLNRPHVTLTPIAPAPVMAEPTVVSPTLLKNGSIHPQSRYDRLEVELRKRARSVPPYLWDTLRTPLPADLPSEEKQKLYYIRSDQSKILKVLRAEWEVGEYALEPEAAYQQVEHDRQEEDKVAARIETVATVVNGSRLR